MSFQSLHYLVFFAAVFGLNRALRRRLPARKNMLLLASYYFYMCWDWRFASLIFVMTAANYLAGRRIAIARSHRVKQGWLGFALVVCLGGLAYFKSARFFIESASVLLHSLGFNGDAAHLQVVLPIGISFFTFQSLSYSLDIFRGHESPSRDFRDFALFVAFFPTLLSGPISRSRQLLPQLTNPLPDSSRRMEDGLGLLVKGYVKKILFADVLAVQWVNPAFANPGAYSPLFLLVALYAYSFEIYMDLSGYTDIARGSAKLLGFELTENFNRPYRALSVSNFWQRWHMSMSSFFRDYLYFGIGGSKSGNVYANILITFVGIGLWHGMGWNFVAYGVTHGSLVAYDRWRRGRREARGLPPLKETGLSGMLRMLVTFNLVAFSRILFRASDLGSAVNFLRAVVWPRASDAPISALGLLVLITAIVLHYLPRGWSSDAFLDRFRALPAAIQGAFIVAVVLSLVAVSDGHVPFVYLQF